MARRGRTHVLVGIDIGTTRVKVGAFEPSGRLLASAVQPTPTTRLGSESAEHDADELWACVLGTLSAVLTDLSSTEAPTSVGVSSFGEAGVALDASGRPLAPVMAWYDARTHDIYREWTDRVDATAVRRLTGLVPDPTYGMFKLAWLSRERPEDAARAVTWLPMADWVAFRLTGHRQIAASQAARTLALDLRSLDWSSEQLSTVGLRPDLLPPVRAAGQAVGRVTNQAARETGLQAGIIVGDTGHDQVMAALGAGGGIRGRIVNSCGTAETYMAFLGRDALDRALSLPDVAVGPHATAGTYYLMATIRSSGSVYDWSVRTFASGVGTTTPGSIVDADFAAAAGAATSAPVGANGVWFIPHLRASPYASVLPSIEGGQFGGIRETTVPGDMLRAVLEGINFESHRHLEPLLDVAGPSRAMEVVAVGGPTRNDLWMQIKADVLGLRVIVQEPSEGALWGAALAGAIGAGMDPRTPEAADGAPERRRFIPSSDASTYRELERSYTRRVARLAELEAAEHP